MHGHVCVKIYFIPILIRFVATLYLLISMQTTYLLMSGKLSLDKPTAFGKIAISFFEIKYCLYENVTTKRLIAM